MVLEVSNVAIVALSLRCPHFNKRRTYNCPIALEWEGLAMEPGSRLVFINLAGLTALVIFAALVYVRTQDPLMLLVGGLISVVSVIGTTMGKSH